MPKIQTSSTSPLRIDAVSVPGTTGLIGMTFCPGKKDLDLGGFWDRDHRGPTTGGVRGRPGRSDPDGSTGAARHYRNAGPGGVYPEAETVILTRII